MGWLAATPDGAQETRRQLFGTALPELPATERLPDLWRDLGYARESFSGLTPFDWQEVRAFADLVEADLSPCEASCLVDMSRAYCAEYVNTNPLRISPMERDE